MTPPSIFAASTRRAWIADAPSNPAVPGTTGKADVDFHIYIISDPNDTMTQSIKIEYSLRELLEAPISDEQHLWQPFLPSVGLAAVVGKPDSGKSMFARCLALAVAMQEATFLDYPLSAARGRALFITTEDSERATLEIFRRQVLAVMQQVQGPELAQRAQENFFFLFAGTLTPQELLERANAMMQKREYDLVVIDAFGDAFTGKDGNNNAEVRTALRPFHQLAAEHECLVLFISHINKAGYNATPDQVSVLGAAAFTQKLRTVLDIRADKSDPRIKYLSVVKGNGVANEVKIKALVLDFDNVSFQYTNTGKTVSIDSIGSAFGHSPIDWAAAFAEAGTDELSTARLLEFVKQETGLKERAAKNRIAEELVRTARGKYRMPPQ